MRNFISVNAKHYKRDSLDKILNHNLRISKIDYLLDKKNVKYKNKNIFFDENLKLFDLDKVGETKEEARDILNLQFAKLQILKAEVRKKNKSYIRKNEATIVEFVVALSREQALKYLEQGKSLEVGFVEYAKNLKEVYGFTPIQVSLHLDEGHIDDDEKTQLNVHAHIVCFNFDFEKERNVLRTLKKQDYRDLQDLASKSFQDKGLKFIRGESKEVTNKEHLERNEFIAQKQKQKIQNLEDKKFNLKSELDELIKKNNALKVQEQSQLKLLEKNSKEYNEIYQRVGELRKQEQQLRNIKRSDEFKSNNQEALKKLIRKNLTKETPIFGNEYHKTNDINTFYRQLNNFITSINKVEFDEIEELKTSNIEKDNKIQELNLKANEKNIEINNLKKANQQLKEEISNSIKLQEQKDKALRVDRRRQNQQLQKYRSCSLYLQKAIRDNNIKITRNQIKATLNKPINRKSYQYGIDR